jgi:hypothetical protein
MTDENEIRQTTNARPAGVCIYCGASDGLSDEHIIPFGLGGNFILPKASCSKCAAITSLFERRVLRGFMLSARTVAALPTRRKKERPTSLSMKVGSADSLNDVDLPVAKYPALLQLPRLGPPGLLSGRPFMPGVGVAG